MPSDLMVLGLVPKLSRLSIVRKKTVGHLFRVRSSCEQKSTLRSATSVRNRWAMAAETDLCTLIDSAYQNIQMTRYSARRNQTRFESLLTHPSVAASHLSPINPERLQKKAIHTMLTRYTLLSLLCMNYPSQT